MKIIIRNDEDEKITLPNGAQIDAGGEYEISDFGEDVVNVLFPTKEDDQKDEVENVEEDTENSDSTENTEAEEDQKAEVEGAVAEKTALAEERAKLAEERAAIAREKAELTFTKLCEEGRAVPAQKEAYMALAENSREVALAEGKTITTTELLKNLFESAPVRSLMEEEGKDGEGEAEIELSDDDKHVAEMFGNSEDELKEIRKGN